MLVVRDKAKENSRQRGEYFSAGATSLRLVACSTDPRQKINPNRTPTSDVTAVRTCAPRQTEMEEYYTQTTP